MADQGHPPRYPRTEYSQDDYTLQSTVRDLYYSELSFNPFGPFTLKDILCSQYGQVSLISSFNEPIIPDSTLTTPVSQNMDFTLNVHKFPPPSSQWGHKSNPVSYTNFVQRDQRMYEPSQNPRMKSNSKDSTLSVESAPHLSEQPGFGLAISPPGYMNSFDSPSNAGPPSPYFQPYNVSGAPPSTSQPLTHSNPYSTPTSQHAPPITPVWSQYPPTSQHCQVQTTAPVPMQPSPPFLRNQKRILEEPAKHENHPMHSQHRLGLMDHNTSRNNLSHQRTRRSESPPTQYGQAKRRKPSGPSPTQIYDPDYESQSVGGTLPSRSQQVQPRHASMNSHYAERSVLSDNERLVLDLRSHEPQLDWKKTAFEYNKITGQDKKVPALQMQCTRAKEKLRLWHEKDVSRNPFFKRFPSILCPVYSC